MQGRLKSPTTRRMAARDIVQFVPFNSVAGSPDELAREVLQELPAQCVGYFKSRGISPHARLPPPPASQPQQ
jgi:hypothetical protein